jgi:hypothetical protein
VSAPTFRWTNGGTVDTEGLARIDRGEAVLPAKAVWELRGLRDAANEGRLPVIRINEADLQALDQRLSRVKP